MTDEPHLGPTPVTNVQPLRLPGQAPPEAHAVALERLVEGMCLTSGVNRQAAEAYLVAFRVAIVAASFGSHGMAVEKILKVMSKRLEQHIAGLPNAPVTPPSAAE